MQETSRYSEEMRMTFGKCLLPDKFVWEKVMGLVEKKDDCNERHVAKFIVDDDGQLGCAIVSARLRGGQLNTRARACAVRAPTRNPVGNLILFHFDIPQQLGQTLNCWVASTQKVRREAIPQESLAEQERVLNCLKDFCIPLKI